MDLYEEIKKADNGDKNAQMLVANYMIFEQGDDIPSDWAERAIKYYESAAEQGEMAACLNLSVVYRFGKGVPRNREKVFFWLNKAAKSLYPAAFRYLGYALEIPVGYNDVYDETADYKAAFCYFFKGAMLDDADCFYKMGDMYFSGKYVEMDKEFAFKMYEHSKEESGYLSDSLAVRLGECYFYGIGTKQDIEKAREYFEHTIELVEEKLADGEKPFFVMSAYKRAKFLLKLLKNEEIPLPAVSEKKAEYMGQNDEEMFKYLAKRALNEENDNSDTLANLANMYKNGIFVDVDKKFSEFLSKKKTTNESEET
ncbi:MAG: sel1 repeat family protein [Defluviitaleaceae bacterium]|nr:sel1 repeat family protein [Defluviitaleaceae bacterium]